MPTYQYRCASCGYDFEIAQKFTDDPLTVCPQCGNPLRKVFNSVGIVFKGSGFYSTDNQGNGKRASGQSPVESAGAKSDAPSSSEATPSSDATSAPEKKPDSPVSTAPSPSA